MAQNLVAGKPVIDNLLHASHHLSDRMLARARADMRRLIAHQAAAHVQPQRQTANVAILRQITSRSHSLPSG